MANRTVEITILKCFKSLGHLFQASVRCSQKVITEKILKSNISLTEQNTISTSIKCFFHRYVLSTMAWKGSTTLAFHNPQFSLWTILLHALGHFHGAPPCISLPLAIMEGWAYAALLCSGLMINEFLFSSAVLVAQAGSLGQGDFGWALWL